MKQILFSSIFIIYYSFGYAQSARLVKDFKPYTSSKSSNPQYYTKMGNFIYFQATNTNTGEELWKSDGTTEGTVLVKDINPGTDGSGPKNFTIYNNMLYFSANNGENGNELWRTDGTEKGTLMVKDIYKTAAGSNPEWLTVYNGLLYFRAQDPDVGIELFVSDGTPEGTNSIDITPGWSTNPKELIVANKVLFFLNGEQLWKTDGTLSGSSMLYHLSSPSKLTACNSMLFFSAGGPVAGLELWKSDGTVEGTKLVKDIKKTGSGSSNPNHLTNINGTLFFTASSYAEDTELWKSDGTEQGTVLIKDIYPGTRASYPDLIVELNGVAYFRAEDDINGIELWRSDGTDKGTVMVKDIWSGKSSSFIKAMINVNGILYLHTTDGKKGYELWKSDGTETGTVLVADLAEGSSRSTLTGFTAFNNKLVFTATIYYPEETGPWISDGTETGTVLLKNIGYYKASGNPSSYSGVFHEYNGSAIFNAADLYNSSIDLWISNGTKDGTTRLIDYPDTSSTRELVNYNGKCFFSGPFTSGAELGVSDGTSSGSLLFKELIKGSIGGNPGEFNFGNGSYQLYFVASDSISKVTRLWVSDGTPENTRVVTKELTNPSNLIYWKSMLYFTATGANGYGFYKTAGTSIETTLIKVISTGQSARFNSFTPFNNVLFFSGPNTNSSDIELWTTDGTSSGTSLFKEINPGKDSSNIANITVMGNTLYFTATDGTNGNELWKSDGTVNGTQMVKDITPGSGSTGFYQLKAMNDLLYLIANDNIHGYELWKSDGTEPGTVLIKDIYPGNLPSLTLSPNRLAIESDILYFAANDGIKGKELWRSDGTNAGTYIAYDVNPGPDGSNPSYITPLGKLILFNATHPSYGSELWAYSTTYPVSLTNVKDENLTFKLFPNPCHTKIEIEFESKKTGNIVLEIKNALGETVMIKEIKADVGNNTDVIDSSSIKNGIYSVQIITPGLEGTEVKTKKLIVLH